MFRFVSIKVLTLLVFIKLLGEIECKDKYDFKRKYKLTNSNASITFIRETHGVGINKLTNCKVQLDDNSIIDLTSLDRASSPRSAPGGDYNYLFNPCSPFACEAEAKTAAVCQKAIDGSASYNAGSQDSVSFKYDGTALTMTYNAAPRTTTMQCTCGDSESLTFIRENPTSNYNMKFVSKCCCPGKCNGKGGGGSSGGLSGGSVILIIFISVVALYFIGGIIVMKFVRQKSGVEMLPNSSVWVGLPGNIKAGFAFTISKFRPGGNQYQQI